MSVLRYNGVQLSIVHTDRYEQKPVMTDDGTDYLYTHHKISVRCVFNPSATSSLPGVALPAVSIAALRGQLLAPRKPLLYVNGGAVILKSPATFNAGGEATCDAKNGPHPISCDVIEVHGMRTFIVNYVIETWTVDSGQAESPLIGHRWEMAADVDELFMTTRTVSGVATFRSDLVELQNLRPDDFRNYLFHPIPTNFMRKNVRVRQASDGLTFYYTFTDEEQWLNLGQNSPVLKIDGFYESGIDWTGGVLPLVNARIHVEAWGGRKSKRTDLINAVTKAAAAWGFGGASVVFWMRASSGVSIVRKHAKFSAEVVLSGAANLIVGGIVTAFGDPFQNNNDLPENLGDIAMAGDGTNPTPPASLGSRGNYLGLCIAQALTTPFAKPSAATNPRNAFDAR